MNRLFLFAGTIIGILILIMTVMMTMNQYPATEEVEAGFAVWQSYGCESCHTLYGQGGNYAPDLTHIYTLRGDAYIRDFIINPAAYHPDERLMPRFAINQNEITQLIAMFEWMASSEPVTGLWPPNPIQVSGAAGLNIRAVEDVGASETMDPQVARGQSIYSQRCASCHSIAEGVTLVGPSFWNLANHAAERVEGQSAREYIRNSIVNPGDFIVEGYQDVMQKNLAEILSSEDINAIIAYLMTFDEGVE